MQCEQDLGLPDWRRMLLAASLRRAYEAAPASGLSKAMEARLAEWRLSNR